MDNLPRELKERIMALAGSRASRNLAMTGRENYTAYKNSERALTKQFYPYQKKRIPFSSLQELTKTPLYSILNISSLLTDFSVHNEELSLVLTIEGTYNLQDMEFNGRIQITVECYYRNDVGYQDNIDFEDNPNNSVNLDSEDESDDLDNQQINQQGDQQGYQNQQVQRVLLFTLTRFALFVNGYMEGLVVDLYLSGNEGYEEREGYEDDLPVRLKSLRHFHLGKLSGYQIARYSDAITMTRYSDGGRETGEYKKNNGGEGISGYKETNRGRETGIPREQIRVKFSSADAPAYRLFEQLSSYPLGFSHGQVALMNLFEDTIARYKKSSDERRRKRKEGRNERGRKSREVSEENKTDREVSEERNNKDDIDVNSFYYSIRVYGHRFSMLGDKCYAEKIYVNNRSIFPSLPADSMLLENEVALHYHFNNMFIDRFDGERESRSYPIGNSYDPRIFTDSHEVSNSYTIEGRRITNHDDEAKIKDTQVEVILPNGYYFVLQLTENNSYIVKYLVDPRGSTKSINPIHNDPIHNVDPSLEEVR